ncbi:MAG: DUF3570 domain-containing protein [bacterium]|nr:DUF3570 domain-containing protein [bacterium]
MRRSIGLIISCILVVSLGLVSQETAENEIQLNFNGYFDNFNVYVLYPSISFTKRVSGSTSVTGRYLVDAISSASMKSVIRVDGVSSATNRANGGTDSTPEELRHEMGLGISQQLGKGILSVNGIYSTEHDYTSSTLAANFSYPFAKQNTTVQLGVVHSWDKVFPQTRDWKRSKNVLALSGGITQVLSKKMVAQLDFSYMDMSGMLADVYQVVTIIYPQEREAVNYEPVHPDSRSRKAIGLRTKNKISGSASLELGYRYYWDDWDVTSHTVSGMFQQYMKNRKITLGLGVRNYSQGRAYFFKPDYTVPERLMTVDSTLDSGYSWEFKLSARLSGTLVKMLVPSSWNREKFDFNLKFTLYHRHTDTPNWHSRNQNLYAYLTSIGFRYRY